MNLKSVVCASVTVAALLPTQAFAGQISSEEASALLNRLNELEQEVQLLRAKLGNVETVQKKQSIQVTAVEKANESKSKTSINWKGAPELKSDDGWSFKPRGRALIDAGALGSLPNSIATNDRGFSNEARRVRLGVQGSIPGGFGYKIEADFADGVELTDVYLDYKDGNLKIKVGQHNNFQSLEELSSSNDTSFIERSAFTDAFGFERKLGVSAEYQVGNALLQGGVFTDNINDLNGSNDGIGLDGRVVIAPKLGDTQLHFGGSVHWRDLGDTVTSVRYRQRPLIHTVDTRFINTGRIMGATQETSFGLEAAVVSGRFHAAGETHWAKITRTGMPNPAFFGGSIEAGIFLTDDSRGYKGGVFKGVKVKNPVGKGGFGALQFNVRYDHLNLVDAGIIGGTQDGYMASLIWTPVNQIRFLINYGHLSYGDAFGIVAGAPNTYSVDVFGARAQVVF